MHQKSFQGIRVLMWHNFVMFKNFLKHRKTPLILPAFNLNFFYVLWLRAGIISWYFPKSNDQFRVLYGRKSAPKGLFYIFDFGTYLLIVPALNLKT